LLGHAKRSYIQKLTVRNGIAKDREFNTKVQESRRANKYCLAILVLVRIRNLNNAGFPKARRVVLWVTVYPNIFIYEKSTKVQKNLANSPNRLPADVKSASVEKEEKRKVKSSAHP